MTLRGPHLIKIKHSERFQCSMSKSSAKQASALPEAIHALITENSKRGVNYPSNVKLGDDEIVALMSSINSNHGLSKKEADAMPLVFKTYSKYHALICLMAQKMAKNGKPKNGSDHIASRAMQVLIKTTIEGIQALENVPPALLIPYSEVMDLFPVNVPANPSKRKSALKLLTKLRVGINNESSSDTPISRVKHDVFTQVAEIILDSIRHNVEPNKLSSTEIRKLASHEINRLNEETLNDFAQAAAAKSDMGKRGRMKARLIDTVAQRMLSLLGRNANR